MKNLFLATLLILAAVCSLQAWEGYFPQGVTSATGYDTVPWVIIGSNNGTISSSADVLAYKIALTQVDDLANTITIVVDDLTATFTAGTGASTTTTAKIKYTWYPGTSLPVTLYDGPVKDGRGYRFGGLWFTNGIRVTMGGGTGWLEVSGQKYSASATPNQ